jgi:hypothetical protein
MQNIAGHQRLTGLSLANRLTIVLFGEYAGDSNWYQTGHGAIEAMGLGALLTDPPVHGFASSVSLL